MTATDLIVNQLTTSSEMLKQTLADFSQEEFCQRPCDKANHPLWQLGHLINSERSMLAKAGAAAMPELPAGFSDRFNNKNNTNDAAFFQADKQQLVDLFAKVRDATIAFTKTLTDADLDRATGVPFAPTLGEMLAIQAMHVTMHLGQFQVARRKLGKPVIF